MAKKKKKTLPKDFKELIEAGDIAALKAVFDDRELDARGGFDKETALHFWGVPDELVRWLVAQGLDINTQTPTYKKTPLNQQAVVSVGSKTVELLLKLGADIELPGYDGNTPLHTAAGFIRPDTVRILIAHGANIHAENRANQTPLDYALRRCANAYIADAAQVAALLLDAGVEITPDMRESVRRIGVEFEFHRENFNKDYLAETDAGLTRLYELFGVTPVAKRRMHDGVSPITVAATNWREQHDELWKYLVPGSGAAQTVQGEVIRITGRILDEMYRNGSGNWDGHFRKMLDALLRHFASGAALASADMAEAEKAAAAIRSKGYGDGDDSEPDRLCELAVKWVLANPDPVKLGEVDYGR